jgi:hypothetical protein
MAYALIWVESLAVALLLVALVTAWTAHSPRRLVQAGPPVLVALLLIGAAGLLTFAVGFLYSRTGALDGQPFIYALSWTVALTVGAAAVLVRGLRPGGLEASAPAGSGTRDAVALALLVLLGVAASLTFGLGFFVLMDDLKGRWTNFTLAMTTALTVAAVAALVSALRRGGPEDSPAARAWPRSRLALGLAAMLVVVCITFTNVDLAIKVEMASVRAEAGSRALALAPPRVLDRDNAAPLYRQAFEALTPLTRLSDAQRQRWSPGDLKFDPRDPELKKFLDSQRHGLALLRQAAARPGCWFGHDYHDGFNLRLPEVQGMREGAAVLACEAVVKAAAGDSRGAIADLALVFRIARHIDEPILISFLVARAVEQFGARALEAVLAVTTPRAEDLAPLLAEGESPAREGLVRALRMEEATGSAFFATLSDPDSTKWLEQDTGAEAMWIFRSSFYRVFFLASDAASYRRTMRGYLDLAERPYYQSRNDLDAFDLAFRRHQGGLLTRLIVPATIKSIVAAARADALCELRRLALAVTAYRSKHGKFPERIDLLVPDHLAQAPLDPFDGQPLRLKPDGKDLLLYSIGPNLRDAGGITSSAANEGDIVFRLRGR